MTAGLRVSVVIPTHQRRESLLRTLASLCEQTLPATAFEVVVSVDGSTDGSPEAARTFAAPYARTVLEHARGGRAGTCNAGIGAAAGEVVVLLDDDMEATPTLLEAHARIHQGAGRRAAVGAAPIVAPPHAPPFTRYVAAGFGERLARLARPGRRLGFREAYTGNFSCRRDVLLSVGGFDERFRAYGHEDYELALRLERAGVELVFSPEALARQHYEKTFRQFARDGVARGRTAVLFAERHSEVTDRLRLSEYGRADWKWRLLRGVLLRLGSRVPGRVVAFVERLERREPAWLGKAYRLAIDYLFWHGVLEARRERRAGARTPVTPSDAVPVSQHTRGS